MAIWHSFQMPDCIRNRFTFCHSLSQYWCYMLTLQGLTYIVGSWIPTGKPIRKNNTGTLTPETGATDSRDLRDSAHLCKLKNDQKGGELQPPRNTSLHKDEWSPVDLFIIALLDDSSFELVLYSLISFFKNMFQG